ncbi:MAG: acetoin:2,6-dichlorophenolindophenol oxidoreductase subunit alpha [Solirubrobacteraceae bacterium]|nr:acetoin:2,6-dichlorophenolindophenol oxidoreductase subunit alpha [Solirubrobacteraceae bacterium]
MPDLDALYERMLVIRRFEETLLDMASSGELVGTTHTYIGQEAGGVGIIDHLDPARDVVFSNHRCHGHYLAFTDDVTGLYAEVMGRVTGVCGGKGGSQHLQKGNFYTNGIQGSIVPVATGIALAEQRRGTGAVTTVFIGDGTLGEGTVYECLNMAALWNLPLLVVVENNRYAQTTPIELAVAGDIGARAEAFGISTARVSTTDVEAIHAAAGDAVGAARTGPFCLILDTYRFAPHSKGDEIRDADEIARAREHDPLTVVADRVPDSAGIAARVEARLRDARAEAAAAPRAGAAAADDDLAARGAAFGDGAPREMTR